MKDTPILDRRYVPKGTLVIREGEVSSNAFLIQSGRVRVFTTHEGNQVDLAYLEAGQIIGEMAMISDSPRTATVQAVEDCMLIVISRDQFEDKLRDSHPTIRAIVGMLSKRLNESNIVLSNKRGNVNDLSAIVRQMYQNILEDLPANQQRTFQKTVLPPLEDMLDAIEGFKDRYGSGSSE